MAEDKGIAESTSRTRTPSGALSGWQEPMVIYEHTTLAAAGAPAG